MYLGTGDTFLRFNDGLDALLPATSSGAGRDNATDLGYSGGRFKDLYLSGGVYLGGTGAANKLDDYEEGEYTATLTPSTSGTISLGSTNNTLAYTKIGRNVHVQGRLIVESVSSPSGYIRLNLPFTVPNLTDTSDLAMVHPFNYGAVSVGAGDIAGFTQVLTSEARLYNVTTGGLVSNSAQQLQTGITFLFSFTYITNA
jgi:hypothetical protein